VVFQSAKRLNASGNRKIQVADVSFGLESAA
jgi:hypothetical protein